MPVATCICTNDECEMYDIGVPVRYLNATQTDPAQWYDEPECNECGERLMEIE